MEPSDATKFTVRPVGHITGSFLIPSYQRGYRWSTDEVQQLLTDIYRNGDQNYCLQPIVVRRDGNIYRVIDGQQRLTTIYLIYKYIYDTYGAPFDPPRFTLSYETRLASGRFLAASYQTMQAEQDTNIDYWFISNAFTAIDAWFSDQSRGFKSDLIGDISRRLNRLVNVIWYEIDESEDEQKLFTRLNIGKIPLTSAELIKAMFLGSTIIHSITDARKNEIALAWDRIEQELSDPSLWFFLTNHQDGYQTRIDLILDLLAARPARSERYYTFFYFDRQKDHRNPEDIWEEIEHTFLILKDWYEDHELYHKIGYLISSGTQTLAEIFHASRGRTKTAFKHVLDDIIRKSINLGDEQLEDLSYKANYPLIQKILLLFNVESVRQNGEQTTWFPFDKYKQQPWSLEHIHAQHAEDMNRQELWLEWLSLQLASVKTVTAAKDVSGQELIARIEQHLAAGTVSRQEFSDLESSIVARLSRGSGSEYLHSIANLALLNSGDNSALSNSTFDVKRTKIIEMDQAGKFIPFCTKMVFLKYYTSPGDVELHFWREDDRASYLAHIKRVLKRYISTKESI